jgi:hypothetical protein
MTKNQLTQYKPLNFTTMKANDKNTKVNFSKRNLVAAIILLIVAGSVYAQERDYQNL